MFSAIRRWAMANFLDYGRERAEVKLAVQIAKIT
jgi:hypothetical protein